MSWHGDDHQTDHSSGSDLNQNHIWQAAIDLTRYDLDTITFEHDLDEHEFESRCDTVQRLFWLQSHSFNGRLAGTQCIDLESSLANSLLAQLVVRYPHLESVVAASSCEYQIRQLIPQRRNTDAWHKECYELMIKADATTYEYYPLILCNEQSSPSTPYAWRISHRWSSDNARKVYINVSTHQCAPGTEHTFLLQSLLPVWSKWMRTVEPDKQIVQSQRLVDQLKYTITYTNMKKQHGARIANSWPEKTSAEKFVFEDVAIASYLSTLWTQNKPDEAPSDVSFCDLGCGNGLLVYMLNRLGHHGCGLDVRSRGIWNWYEQPIDLMVNAFDPCSSKPQLPAGVNWLIGNHSDELTPWIPVLAARLNANYMVLPCCAHDFYGKYNKRAQQSTYASYLQYVKGIGQRIGFQVEQDRLKIPSTKRICFIGRMPDDPSIRPSDDEIHRRIEEMLQEARAHEVNHRDKSIASGGAGDPVTTGNLFKPREAEPIRNCTQIDKQVRMDMIQMLINMLLDAKSISAKPTTRVTPDFGADMLATTTTNDKVKVEESDIQMQSNGDWVKKEESDVQMQSTREHQSEQLSSSDSWRTGGQLTLADCARNMSEQHKKHLKQQFGGLQTLMRNHKHVFTLVRIDRDTYVRLRDYRKEPPVVTKVAKSCWFYAMHPDKCPLADQCPLEHSDQLI